LFQELGCREGGETAADPSTDGHQARIASGSRDIGGDRTFLHQICEIVILPCGEASRGQRLEAHDRVRAHAKFAQGLRDRARFAFERHAGERGRVERIEHHHDPVREFDGQAFQRDSLCRAHDRVIARCENGADLDEESACARSPRGDPAAAAKRIDVSLTNRPRQFDARIERRARHQAHAALGFRDVARGAQPIDIDSQPRQPRARALESVKRALRRLDDKPREIERPSSLRPCAGKPRAAERLHPDGGADHVAVDIDVADFDSLDDPRDGLVDARVQAKGQAVARSIDCVRSIVRDDLDAEDVLQEAYVRAFAGLEVFRDEARIGTWFARIVINEALGWIRRRSRTTDSSRGFDNGLNAEIIAFPGSNRIADPETTMAQSEIRMLLERAIDGLPEGFREVFVARLVEGMSVEETAQLFGIPPQTVNQAVPRPRVA
jgi:RNA polymerase sigma factor (sigma-70 family)